MLGFMSIFSAKKWGGFEHDKSLIKEYRTDHKKLDKLLIKIDSSKVFDNKTKKDLNNFKVEILGHFLSEDVRLYKYLRDYYKNEPDTLELIKDFEKSIKEIQRAVVSFLDRYIEPTKEFDEDFRKELRDIIGAFRSRVKSEEQNLYMLYKK